jgi:thiol-disulfide isomerase/thioredoxin
MIPLPSQEFFESLIQKNIPHDPIVIILFTASWCGPCGKLDKNYLVGLSDKIKWYKCDIDVNKYTLGYCGLTKIPSFAFIKDGKFPSGKVAKGNDKLPVAFGAVQDFTCYACGLKGHKSGDPSCKAGPFDVASNAPKDYKDRKEAKKRKAAGGGGGQGKLKKAK